MMKLFERFATAKANILLQYRQKFDKKEENIQVFDADPNK